MKRGQKWVVLAGAMMLMGSLAGQAEAQSNAADTENRFGIGFQSSWPSYGVSGLYDVSERITVQAIVGALGTVTNFGGRGIYRFQTAEVYDLFAFGSVGFMSYDYITVGLDDDTDTSVGFGAGGGIELDWASIIEMDEGEFPPLYTSIELGFTLANFDVYDYNGFSIGGALHYRF